ncbi:hypothetical protein Tco_0307512 [Tanacetum coccineum]
MDRSDLSIHSNGGSIETGRGSHGVPVDQTRLEEWLAPFMYLTPTYADADHCGMSGIREEVVGKCSVLGDSWLAGHQRSKEVRPSNNRGRITFAKSGSCYRVRERQTEAKETKSSELSLASADVPSSDHLKMEMEMEIPSSSNVKLMTECTDTTYTCYEVMKDLIKVSKLPQTLISYSSSQVHKMAINY